MLRAAAVAAVLVIPALAVADPPGMTPPVAPGTAPVYVPPPSTYTPYPASPYASPYPAPPMGPVSEQPLPPPSTGVRSYRALTIGSDFLAVGMFALAVDHESEDMLALSLGTYALGAPLAHLVKGRTGHALASAGMRIGFPLLGAMIGDGLHAEPKCADTYYDECYDDEGPSGEVVLGVLLGIGAAMVVDSAYLARGDAPSAPPQPQWSPTVRASQGGFALGAAGSF